MSICPCLRLLWMGILNIHQEFYEPTNYLKRLLFWNVVNSIFQSEPFPIILFEYM